MKKKTRAAEAEGKAGAQEATSSRLEEFTTTRNEADKLKAKWAAEKKKEVCRGAILDKSCFSQFYTLCLGLVLLFRIFFCRYWYIFCCYGC